MIQLFSRRRGSLAGAGCFVLVALGGCGGAQKSGGPPPAVPVSAAPVTRAAVPVEWRGVGTVEALSTVGVRAQVGGQLMQVHFTEGQDVRQGELLFTLDARPYEAALQESISQLQRDTALAQNAAASAKRYEGLLGKEYVTADEVEAKRANATALQAVVEADRAAMDRAKLNLEYCTIRSPLAGRTGSLQVYAGNIVKANDDKPMVVVLQIEPMRVGFSLPQQLLAEVRRRAGEGTLKVSARPSDAGAVAQDGSLTFVDNAIDPTSGTIGLKAQFANRERVFWPGQFVQVVLTLSVLPDAVVVPSSAVQTSQDGSFVYIVAADKKVELRPVKLGQIAADRTVIAEGLQGGETVVTDGQLRLAPGALVEIKPADAAGAPPAPATAPSTPS